MKPYQLASQKPADQVPHCFQKATEHGKGLIIKSDRYAKAELATRVVTPIHRSIDFKYLNISTSLQKML